VPPFEDVRGRTAAPSKSFPNFAQARLPEAVTDADLEMRSSSNRDTRRRDFETGIERALRALLISPSSCSGSSRNPANIAPNTAYKSSTESGTGLAAVVLPVEQQPDDQLLDLAIAGSSRSPAVLEKQVRRMLADTRSEALVKNFADQWLYLRNLDNIIPDARLFPDFDDTCARPCGRETELFSIASCAEDPQRGPIC